MNSKRKLTTLTYANKLKAIEAVKNGLKRKEVAAQFGIHESTLSTIIKKEAEILKKLETGESLKCKRRKIAEYPYLEQCLFTWFKQCRNKNICVSGPILKEKAKVFANSLKIKNFNASNGWLENFKKRHDIAFKKMCGDSANVNKSVCQEWKSELHNLVNDYDPNDVFNTDETGLFFKCLPDKTLTFKNEKCDGGKHSKERLTLLLDYKRDCIESDKDDDFNDEPQTLSMSVLINEVKRALTTVRSFIEQCSNIKDYVFSSLFVIENQIDLETVNCLKQKEITDFFK